MICSKYGNYRTSTFADIFPDMYPGEGDPNGMIDTMGGMEDPSASGGIPVWVWIAGGVVAAAAVVAVIIILKKKRARALEDV